MKDNTLFFRSFNGVIRNLYYDYKKLFVISFIISSVFFLLLLATNILMLVVSQGQSQSNSGMMNIAGMTVLIAYGISSITLTTKSELYSKFFFPVSRSVFAIANFVMMLFSALGLIALCSVFATFEVIFARILTALSGQFFFVSEYTISTYFNGMVSFFFYLVAIGSLIYCIFIFIRRWTIGTLTVLAIIVFLPLFILGLWGNYLKIINFVLVESSLIILSMKLFAFTLICHLVAYIPLRKLEVVK